MASFPPLIPRIGFTILAHLTGDRFHTPYLSTSLITVTRDRRLDRYPPEYLLLRLLSSTLTHAFHPFDVDLASARPPAFGNCYG